MWPGSAQALMMWLPYNHSKQKATMLLTLLLQYTSII